MRRRTNDEEQQDQPQETQGFNMKNPSKVEGKKTTGASQQIFTISGVYLQHLTAAYMRNNQREANPKGYMNRPKPPGNGPLLHSVESWPFLVQ